jgi:hypothetical protein
MNDEWRYTATSVTKYDPQYRDANGRYTKDEWIGFFQVGKTVAGELLTFEKFAVVEAKYIEAARLFLSFHSCECFIIKNLEQDGFKEQPDPELADLEKTYRLVGENVVLPVSHIDNVIRLILRDMIWAELFCSNNNAVAVRFGYDLYMYFNSDKNWDALDNEIHDLGLYVH